MASRASAWWGSDSGSDRRARTFAWVAGAALALVVTVVGGAHAAFAAGAREDSIGPAYAQVDTSSYMNDEDNVPIPPNLLEKALNPDSTTAPARADTTRARAATDTTVVIPANPAQPETLRYVPPSDKMVETKGATSGGAVAPAGKPRAAVGALPPETAAVKKKAGLFGLGPMVVILGLAVVHFVVVKTVTH